MEEIQETSTFTKTKKWHQIQAKAIMKCSIKTQIKSERYFFSIQYSKKKWVSIKTQFLLHAASECIRANITHQSLKYRGTDHFEVVLLNFVKSISAAINNNCWHIYLISSGHKEHDKHSDTFLAWLRNEFWPGWGLPYVSCKPS